MNVTHRGLTADRILFTADGRVMLLDPGDGDVAASDLQIRLDKAQLTAELALVIGPDRAGGPAARNIRVWPSGSASSTPPSRAVPRRRCRTTTCGT